MRTIKLSNLARLTNGRLLSFAKLVRTEGETLGDERINTLFNQLDTDATAMTTAMMYAKTNATTAKIEKLSVSINQGFRVLRRLSSALSYSSVESWAEVGKSLTQVFDKYGDITRLSYEDKSAKLTLLLLDLQEQNLTMLQQLGFSVMYDSLMSDHEAFDTLYLQRNSYRDLIKAKVDVARTALESVLTQIINYAVVMSGLDENYDKFVGDMDEFFVWNIVSNNNESSENVSDGSAEGSGEPSVDNEASKGEQADNVMES